MDEALKWFSQHYPLALVVVVAILLTWQVAKWVNKLKANEKECAKIETTIIPKLDDLQQAISRFGNSLSSLLIYLKSRDKEMDLAIFQTKSPVTLTDIGTQILKESGGKKFVDDNQDRLFNEIEKLDIKSPLDVENGASLAMLNATNLDSFTPVKNFLYNNPVYNREGTTVPLGLAKMVDIIAVYLRDLYLEKRPIDGKLPATG